MNAKLFAWLTNISGLYIDGFGCLATQWNHYLQGSLPSGLMKCSCSHGCLFPRLTGIKFLLPQKLCSPDEHSSTPVLGLYIGLSYEDGMGMAEFSLDITYKSHEKNIINNNNHNHHRKETRSQIGQTISISPHLIRKTLCLSKWRGNNTEILTKVPLF